MKKFNNTGKRKRGPQSQSSDMSVNLVLSANVVNLLNGDNVVNNEVTDSIPMKDIIGNTIKSLPTAPDYTEDYVLFDSGANCLLILRN